MLSSAPMKKMDILVLEKDLHMVTEALGEVGAVQFTEARHEEQAELLQKFRATDRLQLCTALLEAAAILSKRLRVEPPEDTRRTEYLPIEVIKDRLESIDNNTADLVKKEVAIDNEIASLTDTIDQVESFRRLDVPVEKIPEFSFLHFATGRIDGEKLGGLESEAGPNIVAVPMGIAEDGTTRIVAITSKKGRWAMESSLEKYGFKPENLGERFKGLPREIYAHATRRLEELHSTKDELAAELTALGARYADELNRYRRRLHIEQQLFQAQEHFGRTVATCVISGWVPADKAKALNEKLMEITGSRAVVEVGDPSPADRTVPTLMRHSRWIRPFELLVSTYGFPGYREIEPTIFVGATFLVMFGLMFGDVGQGLVLAIAGFALARSKLARTTRDIGSIMVFAGLAAIAGGFLFGEFFGSAFRPLWMHIMEGTNPLLLLGWCVALGVFMISLGLVLNIINCFRTRDYAAAVIDKNGVVGLAFYWGVLGLGLRYQVWNAPPSSVHLIVFVLFPVLVILLRVPIMGILSHDKDAHAGADVWIESGMDVFEMIVALLSNTISFVRVGAFALAHAGLAMATYGLAEMASDLPAGVVVAALVIVLGNLLIIAFEGMVVSIQCMRLEYYEFFTKFFKGEGTPFEPFSLRQGS
jgi:V/A-type H+-transporting ATPase subunit I